MSEEHYIIGGGLQGGKAQQTKDELLKSLGLYKRTCSEKKPEYGAHVLRFNEFDDCMGIFQATNISFEETDDDPRLIVELDYWQEHLTRERTLIEPGDIYLPLEALKALPSVG